MPVAILLWIGLCIPARERTYALSEPFVLLGHSHLPVYSTLMHKPRTLLESYTHCNWVVSMDMARTVESRHRRTAMTHAWFAPTFPSKQ